MAHQHVLLASSPQPHALATKKRLGWPIPISYRPSTRARTSSTNPTVRALMRIYIIELWTDRIDLFIYFVLVTFKFRRGRMDSEINIVMNEPRIYQVLYPAWTQQCSLGKMAAGSHRIQKTRDVLRNTSCQEIRRSGPYVGWWPPSKVQHCLRAPEYCCTNNVTFLQIIGLGIKAIDITAVA